MRYALVGNQNCGKTTLFNLLTGSNQHVGNFPGVTVDSKEGTIKDTQDTVVDLPEPVAPVTNIMPFGLLIICKIFFKFLSSKERTLLLFEKTNSSTTSSIAAMIAVPTRRGTNTTKNASTPPRYISEIQSVLSISEQVTLFSITQITIFSGVAFL